MFNSMMQNIKSTFGSSEEVAKTVKGAGDGEKPGPVTSAGGTPGASGCSSKATTGDDTELAPDCANCESKCGSNNRDDSLLKDLVVPQRILDQVEWDSSLSYSVKPYGHHIMVQLGSNKVWPSKVDSLDSVKELEKKCQKVATNKENGFKGKTLVSCIESLKDMETQNDIVDPVDVRVLVFPNMVEITIDVDHVDKFIENFTIKEPMREVQICGNSVVKPTKLKGKAYIFICTHKKRDIRCGTIGPLLMEAFNRKIKQMGLEDQVFIYGSTHYSGHKFAGNCIIYHEDPKLTGTWYGKVTPQNVDDILNKTILKGEILKTHFRGRIDAPNTTESFFTW